MYQYSQQRGFTLIELLSAIAIMVIITAIAAPSYSRYTKQSEVRKVARGLQSALQIAIDQAKTSDREIKVCATSEINSEAPTCLNETQFTEALKKAGETSINIGWIVFRDIDNDDKVSKEEVSTDGDGTAETANEVVFKRIPIKKQIVNMEWSNGNPIIAIAPRNTTGDNGTMCVYAPNGSHKKPANACDSSTTIDENVYEAKVVISSLGKVSYMN